MRFASIIITAAALVLTLTASTVSAQEALRLYGWPQAQELPAGLSQFLARGGELPCRGQSVAHDTATNVVGCDYRGRWTSTYDQDGHHYFGMDTEEGWLVARKRADGHYTYVATF